MLFGVLVGVTRQGKEPVSGLHPVVKSVLREPG